MGEPKFKAGDVVKLKSGGPKMTVVKYGNFNYSAEEEVQCKWFDEKNKVVTDTFSEAELESETPSGPVRLQRA